MKVAMFIGAVFAGFCLISLALDFASPYGETAPTYHCDGSDTMGYAAPGTLEARACWIEENK